MFVPMGTNQEGTLGGITQFEVQVQQGQRWSIHAQFGPFQKDAAIEEAKQLEKMPGINGTKVIREVYNPESGSSQEFVIFKSEGVKSNKFETDMTDGKKPGGDGDGGGSKAVAVADDGPDEDEEPSLFEDLHTMPRSKKKTTATLTEIIVKLLMVMLIGLTNAPFFT